MVQKWPSDRRLIDIDPKVFHDDVIKWKYFPRWHTGPLWGEFTDHRWIPLTKASDAEFWCVFYICAWTNGWVNNRDAGYLKRHSGHYDATVIAIWASKCVVTWLNSTDKWQCKHCIRHTTGRLSPSFDWNWAKTTSGADNIFLSMCGTCILVNIYFLSDLTTDQAIHDDVIKWKHFPRYWPFVRGIHRSTVNSPHKGQWRGALMFSLIYAWINHWVNNREAGDLIRHSTHYDVTVMIYFQNTR